MLDALKSRGSELGLRGSRSFLRLMQADSPGAYRFCLIVLGFSIAALAMLIWWIGPVVQWRYAHDIPFFFDGGWRVLSGIKPHIDHYSPWGPFGFFLVALAMKLVGPSMSALPTANILFLILTAVAAWIICRHRLPAILCLTMTLFLATVGVANHPLRHWPVEASYSVLYNRHGYVFLLLLAIVLYAPIRSRIAAKDFQGSLVAGFLVSLLVFVKISYAMAALLLLPGHFLIYGVRRFHPWAFCLGSALWLLPMLIYFEWSFAPMFRDFGAAAAARSSLLDRHAFATAVYWEKAPGSILLILAALFSLKTWIDRDLRADETPQGRVWWAFIFVCTLLGTAVFVALTNSPLGSVSESPLLVGAGLIFLAAAVRGCSGDVDPVRPQHSAGLPTASVLALLICAIGLSPIADSMGRTALGFAYAANWRRKFVPRVPPAERFASESLRDFIAIGGTAYSYDTTFVEKTNDGIRLLNENTPPTARVDVLDFTNPFPLALLRPPSPSTPVAWHLGFTFTLDSAPAAEQAFAGTDVLMVPKVPEEPTTTDALVRLYGEYLAQKFEAKAESPFWTLHVRRDLTRHQTSQP